MDSKMLLFYKIITFAMGSLILFVTWTFLKKVIDAKKEIKGDKNKYNNCKLEMVFFIIFLILFIIYVASFVLLLY